MSREIDFLILGSSGMQGKIVTRDLIERGYHVALADLYEDGSREILKRFPQTTFRIIDLRKERSSANFIRRTHAAVVVNCAEGDWNLSVYRACLVARSHVLDLGSEISVTRDQLAMDNAFRSENLAAITGCGSTPGINNIMLSYLSGQFSRMTTIEMGFAWDANMEKFVVPFSVKSLMEELTMPAPYIKKKKWSEIFPEKSEEKRMFTVIGRQKSFIVRHPETLTCWEDFKEKGLENVRFYAGFPEHTLRVFRELISLGFDSKEPIDLDGALVRPVDAVSQVMRRLKNPKGYAERENLWVKVEGLDHRGVSKTVVMECLVPTLKHWEDAGCNIDTGLPCSIMAQMTLDGRVTARGSFTPGRVIPPLAFFEELTHRGMSIYEDGKVIFKARPVSTVF